MGRLYECFEYSARSWRPGAYQFGSGWGTADLTAVFSGGVLTLGPNSVNDPSNYWYIPAGGPGSTGNKIMDANMYVEPPAGTFANQTLTFSGTVLSNSLVGHVNQQGNGWTSVAFIKDFAPDYSSNVTQTVPLTAGAFSVSLATINNPARHVQYGFETIGPDVWATDRGSLRKYPDQGGSRTSNHDAGWARRALLHRDSASSLGDARAVHMRYSVLLSK